MTWTTRPNSVERGEPPGVGAGGIDARAVVAGLRRPADDAGVDERRAGLGDDMADLDLGRRAHRVAIDIDRLVVARPDQRRHLLGQRQRVARRQDRQEIVGARQFLVGHRDHAGGLGPLGALLAAAGERRDHPQAALHQPPADAGAHRALRNHRNCRIHDDIPQIVSIAIIAPDHAAGEFREREARLRRRHHRRRPVRADARHRARPPRRSGHPAGGEDLAGAVPGGQRHPGPHHGALPAAGLRRKGPRAGPAAGLSDRHRLFHPLHQA